MGKKRNWFLSGLTLWLLIVVFSLVTQKISHVYTISGWIAMVGIVILGFVSLITIKDEHRHKKKMDGDYKKTAKEGSSISFKLFLFLLPHIVTSLVLIYIIYP
ncbi:hypothetical protein HUG15_15545 [Salicibibacter cibarius]|uniref:DUF5316 domain-containing protein n=1 Tax=Salicibibacter cibarius TaxID=2743000 RepID=A0A7T6Z4V3_9BACI|nr:hypothetical protein [Salicibibacter cibarius]QQK76837.1 hypothetical protein HUG15_15545 [Salicibibacter cibarius]